METKNTAQTKRATGPTDMVGAVVIVGGGISGMQAALDVANSGFKVYLVEKNPSIGGNMAQLDKTFPTNDCSTCMISPKLIEVAKHPNIEILSYSEVEDITGTPGNFKVRIKRKARYVDESICTGCGICIQNCPVQYRPYFEPGANTNAEPEVEGREGLRDTNGKCD
ncbi:MAG: CoB--CoM heterodisulfide reductase iron-sulfur subunit A family protein [Deltaproteobacteria bacterium]|nr:CoB--CoM heterodisulfide reductase iron-sulfur subunit A family protein [Deltaproteobacteria bacterium]MBW1793203.1 CoB--CoM heterodisulfide reductase iron-sulfur subunit A family protein [Deltaproteobacteria bacterium]MBW2329780.1 CoB--CoM heterodisulfide reductase iron-sulfur subunit A family protein [Deltaproteobacteria bacterium]